jgi:ssDNA-binding Zn-finger/Zn-ribbon topoisomerase 1
MTGKEEVKCPDCGSKMILRTTDKIRTRDGKARVFFGCSRFPECRGTHGAHPDGRPLGVPGNAEVKRLRREVHSLLDEIFGEWKELSRKEKAEIYRFMKENTLREHVGEMLEPELLATIVILKAELLRRFAFPDENEIESTLKEKSNY